MIRKLEHSLLIIQFLYKNRNLTKSKIKSIATLYLIFAFLILPVVSFGQKDYQNGYIITNNNDTLTGLVKDRKSPPFGKIYKKIRFKNNNVISRKYGPHQIIGY